MPLRRLKDHQMVDDVVDQTFKIARDRGNEEAVGYLDGNNETRLLARILELQLRRNCSAVEVLAIDRAAAIY